MLHHPKNFQSFTNTYRQFVQEVCSFKDRLVSCGGRLHIQWILRHAGLSDNGKADRLIPTGLDFTRFRVNHSHRSDPVIYIYELNNL